MLPDLLQQINSIASIGSAKGATLVILSHPNFANSVANKTIVNELEKHSHITIRHLDNIYSGYQIDVVAEQAALLEANNIVLQFPLYWYSVPASLKNWLDQVLGFGFAYGPEGDKLKGKNIIISTTVGGPQESYTPLGYNHFPIAELLKPLEQTAYLAQLKWHTPIATHRCVYIPDVYNVKEEVEERATNHVKQLLQKLKELES